MTLNTEQTEQWKDNLVQCEVRQKKRDMVEYNMQQNLIKIMKIFKPS